MEYYSLGEWAVVRTSKGTLGTGWGLLEQLALCSSLSGRIGRTLAKGGTKTRLGESETANGRYRSGEGASGLAERAIRLLRSGMHLRWRWQLPSSAGSGLKNMPWNASGVQGNCLWHSSAHADWSRRIASRYASYYASYRRQRQGPEVAVGCCARLICLAAAGCNACSERRNKIAGRLYA